MSAPGAVPRVTDESLSRFLRAERAALILARSDCGSCAAYEREVGELRRSGGLDGVAVGKLLLDAPGSPRFKRANPWLASLEALPYTLLFRSGEPVDGFAASRGAYLRERMGEGRPLLHVQDRVRSDDPEEGP